MIASILFFFIHVVGLIWTEDLLWGLHIVHKMWYFIGLLPILYTIVRKDYIGHYISAFLLAISITEVFSYLVWFEIIEPFKNASVENPTPFMSHVSYNPILAFAIYLVLHEIFFNKKITNFVFSLYSFFAISMTFNMFITGGRAGQVAFFAMLVVLIIQILDKQRVRSLITIFIVIPSIFFTAYQTSDLFQQRVNLAYNQALEYHPESNNSIGYRITFALNSWKVIKENPIIGIGTGDFPIEYKKINEINKTAIPNTKNPHNMYILIVMELGIIGLISMLSIFYYQIKLSFNSSNRFIRDVGITLPFLFLVIMWSDSYLLGHYTTLMFVFFSSFLYKDFEKY
ncbi:O-antigen ligase family protein [Candidatus Pseudothioglobus singularis]|nr:O-antigen ligase family protein [Candidatus Pseudothioglobus singularis]